MRILHADTDDLENPLRGGQPVRTFEVNYRLARQHEVTVLTASYKDSVKNVVRSDVNYARLGMTIPFWGLSSHLSFLACLPSAIKRMPHDLVVEEFTPPFGFCGLEKYTQKPVVSMVQWFFFSDWQKRYGLPFEAMMRKRAVKMPRRNVIVQTNKMGDYFKDLLPNANIYKVPCGIAAAALQTVETLGDYALYLGRLDTHHKGLDDLLNAWAQLKNAGLHIPLWIVGAGKDESSLKQQTFALGLDELVFFKGRLEGVEKSNALKNCRFLLMPSRQETFGLTALEAMASGKPVVAYDIDHLNELLKPAWSTTVTMGNTKALANAAAQYWQQADLCRQHGQRAFVEAKQYFWDEIAIKQAEVYADVVKNS